MKKTVWIFALIAATVASTSSFANSSKELFTAAQRKEVVRAIDDVCGDTWCEGDFNFQFNDFSCDKKTFACELNFQFIKSDNTVKGTFSPVQICRFENIKEFNQVMDTKYSLADSFYEALTDCISEKEDHIEF